MAIKKVEHPMIEFGLQTKGSYEHMQEAKKYLPGGVTANIKHFAPYPVVMDKGKGAWLKDVDGHWYVDYLMGYGSLALGHGHSKIKEAVYDQLMDDGTCLFGTPHKLETAFAKKIMSYYPSIEKVRYTNSGTEATQLAIRLAQVFTGKKRIAKFEGHYHGGYKEMLYSINPPVSEAGLEEAPSPVPESAGVDVDGQEPYILPFNHLKGMEKLLKNHHKELAAVLIEPVQSGFIPADQVFMDRLRELTKKYGVILIYDEVKTGFRSALGGGQEKYQVKPDLTTLGKVIGGGFPIGVVGGRSDILDVSSPDRGADVFEAGAQGKASAKEVLFHSGTYNGHPTILAAGLATISVLEEGYNDVLSFTNELRKGIEEIGRKAGFPLKTCGVGSIFNVIWNQDTLPRHYRDLQKTNTKMRKELDFKLLQSGLYTKPLNRYSISAAHGEEELEFTLKAYEKACESLKGGAGVS
ncbi:aspartate aminotransferase family protein [Salipaludibacillus aurantiacus]|uniref:Glutamate-1-semialdehyde 2,1-aminomutase n=1 Tax=Salipaludibacillus aurantiacus TaxID=1601833 RepID=A0A1H9T971_9BACI|nr:aspartate aminotransferase family protein [Salipaludibacillus aurantiacus]SER93752.1 glutamate-1-semialdehyde 2,1-aminomutase [Salipaludibacillus aurantiacus]